MFVVRVCAGRNSYRVKFPGMTAERIFLCFKEKGALILLHTPHLSIFEYGDGRFSLTYLSLVSRGISKTRLEKILMGVFPEDR